MSDIEPSRADEPDSQVQSFLKLYNTFSLPEFSELGPEKARDLFEKYAAVDPGIDLPTVEDKTVSGPTGEIPIRFYDPRESPDPSDPLIVFFHGGGFVVGSINTHDGPCRKLAEKTGYPVISVEYSLAPENPFPTPLEECYAVLEWAADNGEDLTADGDRLITAGDSAGGNLATTTALLARDRDGPSIAAQVLVYPVAGRAPETEAYEENAEGYFLTKEMVDWYREQYFISEIDEGNVYARPALHGDLSGLPPATVITAGFDPLRDDGAQYARNLREDGVSVSYHNFPGMIHGFFSMIGGPVNLETADEAYDVIAEDLQDHL